ncbi:iron-containing alcohol dehydrogenase, partial [Oscillibacter sp.]|uniref:iron-containing alcohol dehydrogenase n=1 Tax=Oscillibacter sp. TaxID=1945593 RepID=UPI002D7F7536
MRTIPVKTNPPYAVTIGPGLLGNCGVRLRETVSPCHMAVVTDSTVGPLYLETVTESLEAAGYAVSAFTFPAGEEHKNVSTLSGILEFLAEERLTRSDCLAALGGGVVGDMAG